MNITKNSVPQKSTWLECASEDMRIHEEARQKAKQEEASTLTIPNLSGTDKLIKIGSVYAGKADDKLWEVIGFTEGKYSVICKEYDSTEPSPEYRELKPEWLKEVGSLDDEYRQVEEFLKKFAVDIDHQQAIYQKPYAEHLSLIYHYIHRVSTRLLPDFNMRTNNTMSPTHIYHELAKIIQHSKDLMACIAKDHDIDV